MPEIKYFPSAHISLMRTSSTILPRCKREWWRLSKFVLSCATVSVGQFYIMEGVHKLFCCKAIREFNFNSDSNGKHLEGGHPLIPKAETENKLCLKHSAKYGSLRALRSHLLSLTTVLNI